MASQFKQQQASNSGPWKPKQSVQLIHEREPQVSAIQSVITTTDDPNALLVLLSISESGQVLSEAAGDLHDVAEMDYRFKSSFLLHQVL